MRKYVYLFLFFIPLAIYFSWVLYFAVNVPQLDDFDAILQSTKRIQSAESFAQAWNVLINFHNEHRIAYTRFVSLLVSRLNGGPIDLRILILWGNLALAGLAYLFYRSFRTASLPLAYFLPIPFLLFQLQFFENTFFAMAALQNLGVWCWVGWSLWLLSFDDDKETVTKHISRSQRLHFGGAISMAILATFTSGNGFTVWPIGLVLVLLRRKKRQTIIWLASSLLVFALYFKGFNFSASQSHNNLWQLLEACFGFMGAFVGAGSLGTKFPALIGFILTVGVMGWAIQRLVSRGFDWTVSGQLPLTRAQTFWLAFFVFLVGTAGIVAINRPPALITGTPRYKLASVIALCLFYLVIIQAIERTRFQLLAFNFFLFFSVIFFTVTYWKNTPVVQQQRQALLQDLRDFQQTGKVNNPVYDQGFYRPEEDWKAAIEAGLYQE